MTLVPQEYAELTPDNTGGPARYLAACLAYDLEPVPNGYGFLLCEDEDGQRITAATTDMTLWREFFPLDESQGQMPVRLLFASGPPLDLFPIQRPGWPDDWTATSQ